MPMRALLLATTALCAPLLAVPALAQTTATTLPTGARVVQGSASVQQTAPARLNVTQTTQKAVVNWDSFSVGAGAQVNFAQPGAGSVTLNRVTTPNLPSEILGRITANGQVWLVNPAGVFIGAGARIDVAGFLATTHDIADADFMAGTYRFRATDAPTASVENEGTITVAAAGLAALVAPHVANRGVIAARLGTAVLGAGEAFTVDLAGDGLIGFAVTDPVTRAVKRRDGTTPDALVENAGAIRADGGRVLLTAQAAKGLVDRAVSMSGVIEARSVARLADGTIELVGGDDAGRVSVSGTIDARGLDAGTRGGTIAATGDAVELRPGATLDASGVAGGGTVALGRAPAPATVRAETVVPRRKPATLVTIERDVTVAAKGGTGAGGTVAVEAGFAGMGGTVDASGATGGTVTVTATGTLSLAETIRATGTGGAGGTIAVTAGTKVWEIAGSTLDASGTRGGTIRIDGGGSLATSGHWSALGTMGPGGTIDATAWGMRFLSAQVDVSGATGGGRVRLGGEYQGGKGLATDEIRNATRLGINDGTVIRADATGPDGAGGTVILWAERDTLMLGHVSALPGVASGAGGFVEISAGETLTRFDGTVTASRPGRSGTVLLDPKNIVISTNTGGAYQYAVIIGSGYSPGRNSNVTLEADDAFGAVAISADGTRLAVGANGDDGSENATINSGAVYLFKFADSVFSNGMLQGIVGKGYTGSGNVNVTGLEAGDWFGGSVALSADAMHLAVGATGDAGVSNGMTGAGAVYLFTFSDSSFGGGAHVATIGSGYTGGKNINVSALEANDTFGSAVALSANGRHLAVGAIRDDGSSNVVTDGGAVYLFTFSDSAFNGGTLRATIGKGYTVGNDVNLNSLHTDYFGSGTSLNADGTRLAVGADLDAGASNTSSGAGAVYLFSFADPVFGGGIHEGTIGVGYVGGKNINMTAIDGVDRFGSALSFNADASRLAVGAMGDGGSGNISANSGAVYLITFADTSFSAGSVTGIIGKGYTGTNDINLSSLQFNNTFGTGVALSANGKTLAVGANNDAGNGNAVSASGAVYLFNFSDASFGGGSTTGVIGHGYTGAKNVAISGIGANSYFGASLAMNADGTRLAVGVTGDDGASGTVTDAGAVRLFTFTDDNFSGGSLAATIGKGYTGGKNIDVTALESNDNFGWSVALTADATKLAAGALFDSGFGNISSLSGAVYLFSFADTSFSSGSLVATIGRGYTGGKNVDVTDLNSGNWFGSSVALNADGTRLAVGAYAEDASIGTVRLFTFTDTAFSGGTQVAKIGQGYTGGKNISVANLDGTGGGDNFGISVALTADAKGLAVGAYRDDGQADDSGATHGAVYLFNFTDTSFSGGSLDAIVGSGYTGGKNVNVSLGLNENFGRSVALSADGTRLAVGAIQNSGSGNVATYSGAVHLFTFTDGAFSGGSLVGTVGKGYTGGKNVNLTALEASDNFGNAVAMTPDASRLVGGAPYDDGSGNVSANSGAVYLITFTDASFSGGMLAGTIGRNYSAGHDLNVGSIEAGDHFGSGIAFNADGTRLAVGSYADGGFGNVAANSGAVRLFTYHR